MIFPQKQEKYHFLLRQYPKENWESTQNLKFSFHVKDQGLPHTTGADIWN